MDFETIKRLASYDNEALWNAVDVIRTIDSTDSTYRMADTIRKEIARREDSENMAEMMGIRTK